MTFVDATRPGSPPRRTSRRAWSLALVIVTVASAAACATPGPSATPKDLPGWKLYSSDEFNGSGLDTGRWRPYHSTYGDANLELACLTPNNVAVGGGSMKITALRQQVTCPGGQTRKYTSGFVGTREVGRFMPRFARIEMRAKLPHAQGLWPGFWLRHRDGAPTAEVDIMEYFHSQVPGRSTSTLHLDNRVNLSKKTEFFENPTRNPGWHTWAVEITPAGDDDVRFTFLIDGRPIHTYVDVQHRWASADPNATWDMALNLSVGGRWAGDPDGTLGVLPNLGRCAQRGTPPSNCEANSVLRANFGTNSTMEVDWVRVHVPAGPAALRMLSRTSPDIPN